MILLSGGLDSAVCLAMDPQPCLFVDYGQRQAQQERACAGRLAITFGVSLAEAVVRNPAWTFDPDDPTMLTPGRNRLLIALAATMADTIVVGCNADDYDVYEDCRPTFFAGLDVDVRAPLIGMRKDGIGVMADLWKVGPTWSCYYPVDGRQCGVCDACAGRAKALAA